MTPIMDLVKGYGFQLIAAAVVAAVITVLVTVRLPKQPEAVVLLEVYALNQEKTEDYAYDGYYALQAADLFSNTVMGWLTSPSVVEAIYEKADVSLPTRSLRRLARIFSVKSRGAGIVEAQYRASTEDEAMRLATAMGLVLSQRAEQVGQEEEVRFVFHIVPSEPFIGFPDRNPFLRSIVAVVVVLVIGASGIILVDSLRS